MKLLIHHEIEILERGIAGPQLRGGVASFAREIARAEGRHHYVERVGALDPRRAIATLLGLTLHGSYCPRMNPSPKQAGTHPRVQAAEVFEKSRHAVSCLWGRGQSGQETALKIRAVVSGNRTRKGIDQLAHRGLAHAAAQIARDQRHYRNRHAAVERSCQESIESWVARQELRQPVHRTGVA